jgi:hypothetical protein
LPHLLPSRQLAAKNLISLIGECGNAKEVVIAVQEALERVDSALNEEDDPDDNNSESPSDQLISLIHLYNSGMSLGREDLFTETYTAIPRLKLHKRSPSETIRPLLSQLESTIHLAGSRLRRDQGRGIITSVSQLSLNVLSWETGLTSDDSAACKVGCLFNPSYLADKFQGDFEQPS